MTDADAATFARAFAKERDTRDSDTVLAMGFEEGMTFAAYVQSLRAAERGEGLPAGWVPHTMFFAFVGDELVGRLSIRHQLNEHLATIGGHIGYMVLSDQRRRGYGTEILRQALLQARAMKLARVLLTCDEDNEPSRHMIEHAGGVFESMFASPTLRVPKRRYWIDLT